MNPESPIIAVVGLGYVGLPLAVEFGKRFPTIGFDLSLRKVEAYRRFEDPTGEVSSEQLRAATLLNCTTDGSALKDADFIVVAVPTPVDDAHQPDVDVLASVLGVGLLVPLLLLLYVWLLRRKKKLALRYASLSIVKEALGTSQSIRRHIPPLLFLLAIAAMLAARSGPSPINASHIGVMIAAGWMELQRIPSCIVAHSTATDLVNRRTAPFEVQ